MDRLCASRLRNDRERASSRVEAAGLVPQPEEDLLDDLLGSLDIHQHPARQPVDGRAVPRVQRSEGLLVAGGDGRYEVGVVEVVQPWIHGCPVRGRHRCGRWPPNPRPGGPGERPWAAYREPFRG